MKNIQIEKIKKGDVIKISSLIKKSIQYNVDLNDIKSVRVERVNTDCPMKRQMGTARDYFQLIMDYRDDVDLSNELCITGTRSIRINYKK